MLALGTKIHHTGHGPGTIIAYNLNQPLGSNSLGSDMLEAAAQLGLLSALVPAFYNGKDFPYIVQFDNGYKDVYAEGDVTEVVVS
jgi:hypothetical protein